MKKMKKLLALSLVLLLLIGIVPMGLFPSLSASAILYPGVSGISRRAAAEGIVLLQNDNNVLPLKNTDTISVFGRIQVDYFACGYGSGGDVKYPYVVNLLTGMRRNPKLNINESLAKTYEAWCAQNPPNHGSWGSWPMFHPEMPLSNAVVTAAKAVSDTAVVVIGRSAGEDRESTLTKGSYYLTDLEVEMLDKVTTAYDKVVVVLNVGNIIDMAWVDNYTGKIDSIVYAWQGGMESGSAVADVLSGDETPSGKLAATIAKQRTDYPAAANFGASAYTRYVEDIFVGYRYFETFEAAKDKVKYGFGYGMSYTSFDINTTRVATVGDEIQVDITVKNTGAVKGKEVVQIYYGAPQGLLGKAAKSLVAYAKTNLLQPGASEEIKLSFKVNAMASYDDAGKTGKKSAWVLEAGNYPIYVGNSVRSSVKKGEHVEAALRVTEQLSEAVAVYPVANAFARWTASQGPEDTIVLNTTDMTPTRTINLKQKILDEMPANMPFNEGNKGIKLIDVYNGTKTMAEFMSQMTAQDLVNLNRGGGAMGISPGIGGNASIYGGTNNTLRNTYGIPCMSTTDGPSGIRMTAAATLLPIGTTLACTWNDKLVEELYAGVGSEMILNGSDALLAPGMNLQRDPLCGRNFEYFSEDPLLTGQMGASTVRGVQSKGVSATPKHFAANYQETSRNTNDSRVSERALRELYLKGFEICVKDAEPQNIMMSYNKVNSVWAHYSYELAMVVLRQQWGFKGAIMTDWWIQNGTDPDFTGISGNAYRVRAGVDLLMPGDSETVGNPLTAYQNGNLNIGEIQRNAINTLNFALKSARFRQDNSLPLFDYQPTTETIFKVNQPVQGTPELASISLDGTPISGFAAQTTEYVFYRNDLTTFPTVTAAAAGEATVQITQAAVGAPYATVVARLPDGGETTYRVIWSNAAGLPIVDPNPIYAYLTNIYVNGEKLMNFYQGMYSYSAWVTNPAGVVVTADTPANVTASVERSGDVFTIRAESPHQAMEYIVSLTYPIPQVLPQSDEFDAGPLNSFWTEGGKTASGTKQDGYYQIITEQGDWYQTGTGQKNYVWQRADGDWTSVTKVSYDIKPYQNYQQLGIQVFQDENNFLQFLLEYNNWDGNQTNPFKFSVKNETAGSSAATSTAASFAAGMPATNGEFFLRVRKAGNVYRFDVRLNESASWTAVGSTYTKAMAEPKFSLLALKGATGGAAAVDITAKYDYVRFTDVTEVPVTPPAAVPVVDILGAGSSRLRAATTYFYMAPGLQTESCSDTTEPSGTNRRNVGYTASGLFLLYNIDVKESGYYNVAPRMASGESNSAIQITFSVHVDGERAATFNRSGPTGAWQTWVTLPAQLVYLEEGPHKLMFLCDSGGFNLHYLDFTRNTVDRTELLAAIAQAETYKESEQIPSRWPVFTAAIQAAKNVLNSAAATQADMANAVNALEAATDVLLFVDVTGVTLDKEEVAITSLNGSATLAATVAPANATDPSVTWSSDNEAVATVDQNGKVTSKSVGIANITVTTNNFGKTDSCVVTVKAKDTVYEVQTGETISVPITLENCDKLAGLIGKIKYDDSLLTLQSLSGKNGFMLATKGGDSFIAITSDGKGLSGDVTVGYAVFTAKADMLDDVKTLVTFPTDEITAQNETYENISAETSIWEVSITGIPPLAGDINLDGIVDLVDAILLMQHLSGNIVLNARQLKAGDVNKDGTVNVGDTIIIMQKCLD